MSGLEDFWAKSPRPGETAGEQLTTHLAATLSAAIRVEGRVGELSAVPQRFWSWVCLAALLHDTGKIPDGFQEMVGNGPAPARLWGERHEVLSLGFAATLLADLPAEERRWVALGVLTHHRPLTSASGRGLLGCYPERDAGAFTSRFGHVDQDAAGELMCWLASTAAQSGLVPVPPDGVSAEVGPAAHALLRELSMAWRDLVSPEEGRTAVLLQGAVTLADHLSSAGAEAGLHATQPVDGSYAASLAARFRLHEHQRRAAEVDGHLLLRAPTGTGKTEAAQLWAARQVQSMRELRGGQPRIFYTLPYLASINAMTARLGTDLGDPDLVGVVHSRAALYHLDRSLCDESPAAVPPPDRAGKATADRAGAAAKAVSRAAATRLFREMIRVGTPYQLLRGALAGPGHSGILIDSANSVFILDELHAYDMRRLGYLLAMAGFWEQIGGRIAVISATFPQPLAEMLSETLAGKLTTVEVLDRPWPVRHRLTIRGTHLTSEEAAAEIGDRLRAGQAVLLTANNVADARTMFERLGPVARACHGDEAADLLHSRFRAMDRRLIEERIRGRYGTGRPRKPGLVVATQAIEVSLDVDFDALHSSGAPLEALIQRFGRVNRIGERPPANVVVHVPVYRPRRGTSAELWADGVYEFAPTELAMEILAGNDGAELSERDLAAWLDEIYGSAWGEEWCRTVTRHRTTFESDFLSFDLPFDDREALAGEFDKLFDGTEAILESDKTDYTQELNSAHGRAGRLLGSQYLIPLPHYASGLGRYDRELRVTVIDADYDSRGGLGKIHGIRGTGYQPGEIL